MGKYLEFYEKYYGKQLPTDLLDHYGNPGQRFGLCRAFLAEFGREEKNKLVDLFEPDCGRSYWGSEADHPCDDHGVFNPLRQTIVLLMAAYHGELTTPRNKPKSTKK